MAGRDLQSASGFEMRNKYAAGGSRRDSRINNATARRQQPRDHRMLDHQSGRTTVAAQDDRTALEHRAQSAGKSREVFRIKSVADHTTQAGDTQNPFGHLSGRPSKQTEKKRVTAEQSPALVV